MGHIVFFYFMRVGFETPNYELKGLYLLTKWDQHWERAGVFIKSK